MKNKKICLLLSILSIAQFKLIKSDATAQFQLIKSDPTCLFGYESNVFNDSDIDELKNSINELKEKNNKLITKKNKYLTFNYIALVSLIFYISYKYIETKATPEPSPPIVTPIKQVITLPINNPYVISEATPEPLSPIVTPVKQVITLPINDPYVISIVDSIFKNIPKGNLFVMCFQYLKEYFFHDKNIISMQPFAIYFFMNIYNLYMNEIFNEFSVEMSQKSLDYIHERISGISKSKIKKVDLKNYHINELSNFVLTNDQGLINRTECYNKKKFYVFENSCSYFSLLEDGNTFSIDEVGTFKSIGDIKSFIVDFEGKYLCFVKIDDCWNYYYNNSSLEKVSNNNVVEYLLNNFSISIYCSKN